MIMWNLKRMSSQVVPYNMLHEGQNAWCKKKMETKVLIIVESVIGYLMHDIGASKKCEKGRVMNINIWNPLII